MTSTPQCPPCPLLLPEATTSLRQLPKGIMSLSLGKHAEHTFARKVQACAKARYEGIEVHFEDAVNVARSQYHLASDAQPSEAQLLSAAATMKQTCDEANLRIICLEPFLHYPGCLPLSKRDARVKDDVPLWFALSDELGTDVIQVASAMFGGEDVATSDEARIVEDLRLIADAGLSWRGKDGKGGLRTKYWAYEAMCFGAYTTTWEQAWRQIQLVDRPNFGMVVDTFQICGAYYADPSAQDGSGKARDAEEAMAGTLARLRATFGGDSEQARINRSKVFFVQLGDAKQVQMSEDHPLFDAKQHSNMKMAWARSYRLFQGEGYLPCHQVAQLFLEECGWRGWMSAEYFNVDQTTETTEYVDEAAERCMKGHEAFLATTTEKTERALL